jgi:hypothetical protein
MTQGALIIVKIAQCGQWNNSVNYNIKMLIAGILRPRTFPSPARRVTICAKVTARKIYVTTPSA